MAVLDEPNAFSGATLDRATDERKDPDWVAAQCRHRQARAVLAGDAGVQVVVDEREPRLALVPLAAAPRDNPPLLLGLDDRGPVFAVDVDPPGDTLPRPLIGAQGKGPSNAATGTRPVGLRDAVASLPQSDGGLVAYACALVNWHRRHGHCGVCGAATELSHGGLVRVCPGCGSHHFPRTDPVVIMLVTDEDRVLLGRQASWPPGRYSTLAGFVEPGESLEEAVRREVREEAAVDVGAPVYLSSQPWPFPSSLMLGFTVPWTGGEPVRQEDEIEDVRWFSRAELAAAASWDEDGPLALPPRHAIARRLIESWLEA